MGWALLNGAMVGLGLAALPGISLVMGFLGAAAVIALSALLSKLRLFDLLRYAGENTLVIYLAFFLPMAATRVALLKTGIVPDIGTVALIMTGTAVIVPLVLHAFVRGTWLSFLFERPRMFMLGGKSRTALAPAE